MISKHRLITLMCAISIVAGAGFLVLRHPGFLSAQTDDPVWKNFSETRVGVSLDYPQNWSFNVGYDKYARGLMNIDIVNKKCGDSAGKCAVDCVDIRVFIGGKPDNDSSQLFIQLYEDALAVEDTDNPGLVRDLDIGGKTVYEILNDQPTLSLNGSCAGPLYIFDAGNGKFAYVFSGHGSDAAAMAKQAVQKIISSFTVGGAK